MAQLISSTQSNAIRPSWLTIFRVALGIILIWKGINFIRNTAELNSIIEKTDIDLFSKRAGLLASTVSVLSLMCGFFITVGLFTRLSCIIQIPIVIAAIILINSKNIESNSFELFLTIVVFVLLVVFAIKGSGPLSADEYFRRGAEFDKKN